MSRSSSSEKEKIESIKCKFSPHYFVHNYVKILSDVEQSWVPFKLWPSQVEALNTIHNKRLVAILKARQLGFTWLSLSYVLHQMIYNPITSAGLFSKGDTEAQELLDRLKGMYFRLPEWIQADGEPKDNAHVFELSNGSKARALPTTGGESWSFTVVLCDEFDRFDNADRLMINVKPTIDAGNKMIVGSISDKTKPNSIFKQIFKSAQNGENSWEPLFMPWHSRPDRDQAWRDNIVRDAMSRHIDTNSAMDEVNQQYPETVHDALAPAMKSKRIPYTLMTRVFDKAEQVTGTEADYINDLVVYHEPEAGRSYVIGCDPAEGVGGDDSCAVIMDEDSGLEMAIICGQQEPKKVFPRTIYETALYYNEAGIMVERNNHGHAVIGELMELTAGKGKVEIMVDPKDKRMGWLTSPSGTMATRGKVALYNNCASQINAMDVTVSSERTFNELCSIGTDLKAPKSLPDHLADSFALACSARISKVRKMGTFVL